MYIHFSLCTTITLTYSVYVFKIDLAEMLSIGLIMENNYDIATNLRDRTQDRRGTCKVCGVKLLWTKAKLESHERSGNCTGQSREEKDPFKSKTIVSQTVRSVPSLPDRWRKATVLKIH